MTRKENVPYLVDSFANGIFQLTLAKSSIDRARKIYDHESSNIKLPGSRFGHRLQPSHHFGCSSNVEAHLRVCIQGFPRRWRCFSRSHFLAKLISSTPAAIMFILKAQHPLFMSFVLLNFSFFPSSSNKFILILGSRHQGTFYWKRGGIDRSYLMLPQSIGIGARQT